MTVAAIIFSSREWLGPAAVVLVVCLALLVWNYRRAAADKKLKTFCFLLKLLGVLALAVCLLEPQLSSQRVRPGANYFAVVADNSQGMKIKDRGAAQSRGESLTNLLATANAKWMDTLEENFKVRRYYFDTRLQNTRNFSELQFDGRASAIGSTLRTLGERYHGQPLAGVLLFTDGNATDLPEGVPELKGLPPVYPVTLGLDETINDIAIQKITASQTSFEDAPVTLQVEVSAGGYDGRMLTAQLVDQSGKTIEEINLRASRESEAFRFQVRPETSGISLYRVRVSAKAELGQFADEQSAEATLVNNSRVVAVDRGRGPYRVLYVCGRPNWEFKFLNRALAEDHEVALIGLIRIAKREKGFGHFEFRSRPGESSNPLFRGFDRTTEDTEGYDEPVLKWLLPSDTGTNWISRGFPKTAEELFKFHALILDDLEAEFFTRDQMSLLQKFVSERGGGFLMLGGAESFKQGNYEHSAIGEMLPVYLDSARELTRSSNYRLELSREGWLEPWVRLRDNEVDERKRLADLPAVKVLNTVRSVKPGASIIAEVLDDSGRKLPALVAQRFGNGRVGALLVGDLWRAGLRDELTRHDLDKAWRQMIRWLIADVPAKIEFLARPHRDDPNQSMQLQVRVRDEEFKPLDNASVKVTVTPVHETAAAALENSTNTVRMTAEPAATEAGLYEALYVPRQSGAYLAEAVVTDAAGVEVGRTQTAWATDAAAEEFKSLKPNRALLEAIARQTGGDMIEAADLASFAGKLPNREAPITETWSRPIWDRPWVFLFALACFAVEWGVRRWKGLA